MADVHDIRSSRIGISQRAFDACRAMLDPGEPVQLVATTWLWYEQFGTRVRGPNALMLTPERLLITKNKTFGGYSAVSFPIGEFRQYGVDMFGGGPHWELLEILDRGQLRLIFDTQDEADIVAGNINARVVFWRNRQT